MKVADVVGFTSHPCYHGGARVGARSRSALERQNNFLKQMTTRPCLGLVMALEVRLLSVSNDGAPLSTKERPMPALGRYLTGSSPIVKRYEEKSNRCYQWRIRRCTRIRV